MSTVIEQNTVTSKDGTVIAYSQIGQGPALILVDGALCYREFGPSKALAAMLSPHFTVATYDRRGRGESGDTLPYAVEREVEDLEALIEAVGGTAFVAGQSSGSALVIEAANRLSGITKLALYEAPFVVDDTGKQVTQAFLARLKELVVENQRTKAVKLHGRHHASYADVVKTQGSCAHTPLRYQHSGRLRGRQTIAKDAGRFDHRPHAGHGWGEKSDMDASFNASAGTDTAQCELPHPGRADPHGQGGSPCSRPG